MLEGIIRVIYNNYKLNDNKLISRQETNALRMRACNICIDKHTNKEFLSSIEIIDYRYSYLLKLSIFDYINKIDGKSAFIKTDFRTNNLIICLHQTDSEASAHNKLFIDFNNPFNP